ncbi:hypothetical protein GCM10029992_34660 [Glycomyces albus]
MRSPAMRSVTSTVVLGLGLALSAGCALNEGDALAEDFEDHWTGTPDVAQIETIGDNTLPFAGSATGTLVLEDGTPADRTIELANELSVYIADYEHVEGRIEIGELSFSVTSNEERTEDVLTLWESLAVDDRVEAGDIEWSALSEDRWDIEVTMVDAAAVLSVFEDLAAEGDSFRPFAWTEDSSLEASGGSIRAETGTDGRLPTEAMAAYEAVAAQYPVVGAYLGPDRLSIRVSEGTDLAQAEALAKAEAPGLGDRVEVIVDGT